MTHRRAKTKRTIEYESLMCLAKCNDSNKINDYLYPPVVTDCLHTTDLFILAKLTKYFVHRFSRPTYRKLGAMSVLGHHCHIIWNVLVCM